TASTRPGYRLPNSSARATAAGSESRAITRLPLERSNNASVCPPAPNVASSYTARLPSPAGKSSAMLSSSMTDACSVEAKLRHQFGHAVRRFAARLPAFRRPQLDPRQRADQHHVAIDFGEVAQCCRHHQTTLSIERHFLGMREEVPHKAAVAV